MMHIRNSDKFLDLEFIRNSNDMKASAKNELGDYDSYNVEQPRHQRVFYIRSGSYDAVMLRQ